MVMAVQLRKNTGVLQVSLPYDNLPISVGAANKAPQFIGRGSATIRLKPGSYTVAATVKGNEVVKQVRVVLGQTTKARLDPASSVVVPSADNVNFTGLDSLLNIGLTQEQLNIFKYQAFAIKPLAKNIAVDPASVETAPYNPETSATFGVSFDFDIDSVTYHAKLTYQGLTDLGVVIKDSTGKTVSSLADKSPF